MPGTWRGLGTRAKDPRASPGRFGQRGPVDGYEGTVIEREGGDRGCGDDPAYQEEHWIQPLYLAGGKVAVASVADELVKVQVALSNIAGKRERIKILFKKIEDVIKYLDPQYIDRMAVPDAMKLQFILAEEQVIPSRAALLEQVNNLQPILDSTSIQAVPDHAAKLQRLSQIHIQQQEQRQDLTDSVKTLLEDYNKMTLLLSKQFVQWNEILTQLETAKEAKPAAE
ncbi:PREDICTED: dynactin subunit 3 [Charadrius vociferus]|uniref:dynactin subunit 3 n=1 Tax=Charadrius vociferus TaxID=50402 RepID=UPI000521AF47|nr:PREDICTED: dynactin subunit 3 [Charadrius vociferus]